MPICKKVDQKTEGHLHYGILCSRKKELLPFVTARIDLESIMLSEISQAVKDEYHMMLPISGTQSTKQISKQNITRYIESKSKLTLTRGEVGGDIGGKKGEGSSRTCIKDKRTKPK